MNYSINYLEHVDKNFGMPASLKKGKKMLKSLARLRGRKCWTFHLRFHGQIVILWNIFPRPS